MIKTGSTMSKHDKNMKLKTDVSLNNEQSEAQDIIDWYYSNRNTTHVKMIEPVYIKKKSKISHLIKASLNRTLERM
jgi:hypothetical protein